MDLMHHSSFFLLPPPQYQRQRSSAQEYALVIVDQTLPDITPHLWANSQLHVCPDHGANRLYDEIPKFFPHQDPSTVRERYKPEAIIIGNFSSIRAEVLDFYSKLGTRIVDLTFDLDTTHLHKCVVYIRGQSLEYIILVTDPYGGRFDQWMGSLNVLYRFSTARILFINDGNLTYLLTKTHRHQIKIQPGEGPTCGLIPLGMPTKSCTTTGLMWNLFNTEMRFGGLISTSNLVNDKIVTVEADSDLLWTIALKNE